MSDYFTNQAVMPEVKRVIPERDKDTELGLSTAPRIDAVTIMDFDIVDIKNLDTLCKRGIVSFNAKLEYCYYTQRHEPYTAVNLIYQECFDMMMYKTSSSGEKIAYMSISIGDPFYHNLYCYSIEQYKTRLEYIRAFLASEYGILIDFTRARFHRIEINMTYVLEEEFKCYQRPLTVIFKAFPKVLRLKGEDVYSSEPRGENNVGHKQSFRRCSGSRGLEVKAYDKGAELRDRKNIGGFDFSDRLMRFEISLKHQQKIYRAFGTDLVYEVTDQLVYSYYSEFVQSNIADALKKWDKARRKQLCDIVKRCLASGEHNWTEAILLEVADAELQTGLPIILDAKELIDIIEVFQPFTSRQSRYATEQRIKRICREHIPTLLSNDDKRLEEIKSLICMERTTKRKHNRFTS